MTHSHNIQRTLSSVTTMVIAAVLTITGIAVNGPSAQGIDTPVPMSHTIDYLIISPTNNTSFVSTADLQTMTLRSSDAWNRMSRGVVTDINMGKVFTMNNYPATDFCTNTLDSERLETTMGYSPDIYQGLPNGRTLAIVGNFPDTSGSGCDSWAGLAITPGRGFSTGGVLLLRYMNNTTSAQAMTHELGHLFGISHAGVVPPRCNADYWDGPFGEPSDPIRCGLDTVDWYGDQANVMGSSYSDDLDINGYQKYQLGLIQPGAGLVQATPAAEEQLITIHDIRTDKPDLPQAIQMSDDDPDGTGGCAAPLYDIDYDPWSGGVRVYHIATPHDCGTNTMSSGNGPKTIAWMVPLRGTSRTYFLPGESQLTASGKIQVKVVSTDPGAGTATVSIRRTDSPGITTLQVTSANLLASTSIVATGGMLTGTVTTNQAGWRATSDQPWVAVTASGTTGQHLVVSVAANATSQKRTAVVTVQAGSATQTFNIVQDAGDQSLATDCGSSVVYYCTWTDLYTPVDGTMDVLSDADWFKFTAPVTGTYTFTSASPTGKAIPYLTSSILDAGGTPVPGITGYGFQVGAFLTAGQDYFFAITSGYTGNYRTTATIEAKQLTVSPASLTAKAGFDILAVTITTNESWQFSGIDWVVTFTQSGRGKSTVLLTILSNATGQPRTGTVRFTAGGDTAEVTINQPAAPDDCGSSTASNCTWQDLSQPVTGEVEVAGDTDWFKFTAPTTGDWVFQASGKINNASVKLYAGDGTTLVASDDVDKNGHMFSMTASLAAGQTYYLEVFGYLSTGGYAVTATTVSGPVETLSVSPASLSAGAAGDTQTVDITASGSWTVSGPDWMSFSQSSGTGDGSVQVTTTANTSGQLRMNAITVTMGSKTATVAVAQPAVRDDCGATTASNCEWASLSAAAAGSLDYAGDKDWFRFAAPVTGTYTFTASQSATEPVRNTAGAIYGSDGKTLVGSDSSSAESYQFRISAGLVGGQTYYLEVSGTGMGNYSVAATVPRTDTLSLSTTALNPDGGGISFEWIQVTSNTSWTVAGPNWTNVFPASGSGNGWVAVTVYANVTGSARMGQIVFTAGTTVVPLVVSQTPQPRSTYLTSPITAIPAPATGTTTLVWFLTDGNWGIATPAWVTASKTIGTGSGSVEITVAPNTTGSPRSGWIAISTYSSTAWILVTQS